MSCGFARGGDVLKQHFPDLVVSKQKLRRVDAIACARLMRQEANQNLGSLPGRSSCADNRLVPIFLAALAIRQQSRAIRFRSAAEMLDTFGMHQGGTQYRRLMAAFQRIFGATIFFGTDTQREKAAIVHRARFKFHGRSPDLVFPTLRAGDLTLRFPE